jgi:SAM-dependent methyltransferase
MTQATSDLHKHLGDAARLAIWDTTHAPLNQQMVDALGLSPGNRVLDVGFGAADTTFRIAAAVPDGAVLGVERSEELVEIADAESRSRGVNNVRFMLGDATNLDHPDNSFDIVWSSRVVHGLPNWLAGIMEFRRVTKPGGRVVIREGAGSPTLLPADIGIGEPGLSTRLVAAQSEWFAEWRREMPGQVRYTSGWLTLLEDAGLTDVTAQSFLFERTAPFTGDEEKMIVTSLAGYQSRETLWKRLNERDQDTLIRLTEPNSPAYVMRRTDLHYVITASLYSGVVPSS